MEISVIIPVYNAQQSIARAVKSVVQQTYQELELLLVDDGSQDESLRICHALAEQDSRIRVFSQKNAGPGAARGKGIAEASGRYVFFLDADDELPEHAFAALMRIADSYAYDVIKGLYYHCRGNERRLVNYRWTEGVVARVGTKAERARYRNIKTSSAFGYLWGTLYKREFLLRSGVSLEKIPLRFMEDTVFNLELFACAPSYYVLCEPVYCYTVGENGLSAGKDCDFYEQVSAVLGEYTAYLKAAKKYEENLDLLLPLLARCFCWAGISHVTKQNMRRYELEEKIRRFAQQDFVQEGLREKTLRRQLFSIGSRLEALAYYTFCTLLKWKAYRLLANLFLWLQIPMRAYVKHTLKS